MEVSLPHCTHPHSSLGYSVSCKLIKHLYERANKEYAQETHKWWVFTSYLNNWPLTINTITQGFLIGLFYYMYYNLWRNFRYDWMYQINLKIMPNLDFTSSPKTQKWIKQTKPNKKQEQIDDKTGDWNMCLWNCHRVHCLFQISKCHEDTI